MPKCVGHQIVANINENVELAVTRMQIIEVKRSFCTQTQLSDNEKQQTAKRQDVVNMHLVS